MTDAELLYQRKRRSVLLGYLPAIYSEDESRYDRDWLTATEPDWNPPFLNDYLIPYEQILFTGYEGSLAIEEEIRRLPELLDPGKTEERLLPWLGKWAAFAVRSDVPVERTREALKRLISLYPIRGTSEYIETLLELFIDAAVTVVDGQPDFEINRHSTIGLNSYIGGGAPWFFRVFLRYSATSAGRAEFHTKLANEIVEMAKPAHTAYSIEVVMPRMQIAVRSTINLDSIL
jgi:phage tail-like protein